MGVIIILLFIFWLRISASYGNINAISSETATTPSLCVDHVVCCRNVKWPKWLFYRRLGLWTICNGKYNVISSTTTVNDTIQRNAIFIWSVLCNHNYTTVQLKEQITQLNSCRLYNNQRVCNIFTTMHSCHSVKNRTVVQLPLTASHPALGCRAFIPCTNLPYAFWVTLHF